MNSDEAREIIDRHIERLAPGMPKSEVSIVDFQREYERPYAKACARSYTRCATLLTAAMVASNE